MPGSNRPMRITGKKVGCLFPVLAVLGLLLVSFVSTLVFQPQRLAQANACRGPVRPEPSFINTCKHEVNTRVCIYVKGEDVFETRNCRTEKLAPGEGMTGVNDAVVTAKDYLRTEVYTCKAPYLPGDVEDAQTHRIKQGCTQP